MSRNIGRGGLQRSVTLTVEFADGRPFTFLAGNQKLAAERLIAMPELPRKLLSISTPDTIHADLCGESGMPRIEPLLMACFEQALFQMQFGERERTRLYKARRQVAAMRGEAA